MTSRHLNLEENLASLAPVGPCGHIYLYNGEQFPVKEASLLGNLCVGKRAFGLPLLFDLTVENGFAINVKAVHRKLNPSTVSARVTSAYRELLIFQGTEYFDPIFQGPGLPELCEKAARIFGFPQFQPLESPPRSVDVRRPLAQLGLEWNKIIGGVVITQGFKERLMAGCLAWLPCQAEAVKIGQCAAVKVPLYDKTLFPAAREQSLEYFYDPEVNEYLFYSLFTSVAQALRVRDVDGLIKATEDQFLWDQYKTAKLATTRDYPSSVLNVPDAAAGLVIDAATAELALSYGISFLDSPKESTPIMSYTGWAILADCETPQQRYAALEEFLAKLSTHVHAQIFSANSVLYLNRMGKVTAGGAPRSESAAFNSFFFHGGLGHMSEIRVSETGTRTFSGADGSKLDGTSFTIHHLAYAASFSPQCLARLCFYLQFAQHQRVTASSQQNLRTYLTAAANSQACDICRGTHPACCINTLKFRLDDRFPQVTQVVKREPYVVTGVTGAFNDLGILGNFAGFKDKEEDPAMEDGQRYTYWQLLQRVGERLQEIGVGPGGECPDIKDARGFVKLFRAVDQVADSEALSFVNSMVKNNLNFRDSIKNIHHVMQLSCNTQWLPPCQIFQNLFTRSLLAILQDIALPICAAYEQDNPAAGTVPSEWLRTHFQTLWTNFKSACFDKGVVTGADLKVVHSDGSSTAGGGTPSCDFFDVESCDPSTVYMPMRVQLRIARPLMTVPRMIKMKNRIIFSNSGASEVMQSSFVRVSKEQYITCGPYVKFLHDYHKVLFPGCRMSAVYLWNSITETKQIPLMPGIEQAALRELVGYVNTGSRQYDETNVIDTTPHTVRDYALHRLNNAILRSCGQTQYYAATLHALLPLIQNLPASEYPHVLGSASFADKEEFLKVVHSRSANTVVTSQKQAIYDLGKMRPVITVPIIVNKYSGVSGNAQIFQCANIGYFTGRGVDRNLMSDGASFRKQSSWAFMRRRHVFMTPLVDTLIKKSAPAAPVSEIELLKRNILNILDKPDPDVVGRVTLELGKSLGGSGCCLLTAQDLEFYLGHLGVLASEVYDRIMLLRSELGEGEWSEEDISRVLERAGTVEDLSQMQFVALDDIPVGNKTVDESAASIQIISTLNRKRRFGANGDLDL